MAIAREFPCPGALAWGEWDRETDTMPVYKAGGELWFTYDGKTGKSIDPPREAYTPLTDAEHAQLLHDYADESTRGICYFIGADHGPIKIGYSIDPPSRLRALQSSSPLVLTILATRAGGAARETAYHQQFAEHRLHGEWFTRTPEIEAEIARLTATDLAA